MNFSTYCNILLFGFFNGIIEARAFTENWTDISGINFIAMVKFYQRRYYGEFPEQTEQ